MSHRIKKKASLLHILCGREYAMKEDKLARRSGQKGHIGRITCRHDSIMFEIFRGELRVVKRFKKAYQEKKLGVSATIEYSAIQFRSELNVKYKHLVRVPEVKKVLAKAVDWKLMFDMNAPESERARRDHFHQRFWHALGIDLMV